MKIAIVGGGPIGMEALLYGTLAGADVQLFERGRIGENVRRWGHVGLFTEWKRDRSPLGERLLRERGDSLPDPETSPDGDQLADYLMRLASLPQVRNRIVPQTEVKSLTREGLLKHDLWGDPRRACAPFRLMTAGIAGEQVRHFDAVIDATGVYSSPNWVGNGGAPCPGELGLQRYIDYAIPDVKGADKGRFEHKRTIVVGTGHSAATTLLALADLLGQHAATRLIWVVRRGAAKDGSLYYIDSEDVSSGRRKLGERANELAKSGQVDLRLHTVIERIERHAHVFNVELSDGTSVECNNLCAGVGFRPDPTLWQELQISQHPASGGPGQLAAAIMDSNKAAGVGLSTGYAEKSGDVHKPEASAQHDPLELLKLDEPNFYVLGIKSYGRDAGFLMQNGFRQVRDVYRLLCNDDKLDLYDGAL